MKKELIMAKQDSEVPQTYIIIQCVLPFIVIGIGTILTGNSMAGFALFYLVN